MARNSLRVFMVQAKNSLRASIDKRQKVTLVIGNESADLDSITSSILYAYIRSNAPPLKAFSPLYVPITNIPAADIQLRPELLTLLPHANLQAEHLITLDDLPNFSNLESKLCPEHTKWVLVDHNALQGTLGSIYADRVKGVIDHHDDDGKVPKDTGDEPRIIDKSGSCTSLVTEYCRRSWDALSSNATSSSTAGAQGDSTSDDEAVASLWDAQIAKLALASILIDTVDLTATHKVTRSDTSAIEYLEAKIMACPRTGKDFQRSHFFEQINKAKTDISSLKLKDILRKDYKQWTEGGMNLGISSVVKDLNFLRRKAKEEGGEKDARTAFVSTLKSFAKERDLAIMSVMTASASSEREFSRELLVLALTDSGVKAAERFLTSNSEELGLEKADGEEEKVEVDSEAKETTWVKVWKQGNVDHSRKRVAPMLRQAMS
ncbi:Exopolyphosphatase [Elasticomyces elasticus]|nr:Exopolyphosphatase [Elasticomyces elasticus]